MKFTYHNHRDETEERNVTPLALLYFASPTAISPYLAGYAPGWFLECVTHDRGNALRHFALDRIDVGAAAHEPMLNMRFSLYTPDAAFVIAVAGGDDKLYRQGYAIGAGGYPFDFDLANSPEGTAWAHGYNEGRRHLIG
jgi:hypothetical protein